MVEHGKGGKRLIEVTISKNLLIEILLKFINSKAQRKDNVIWSLVKPDLSLKTENKVVSKSGNLGLGPVPKILAQIRIFLITSLLRH